MKPLKRIILLFLVLTVFSVKSQNKDLPEQEYFSYTGSIGKYPVEFVFPNNGLDEKLNYNENCLGKYMYMRVGSLISLTSDSIKLAPGKTKRGYVRFYEGSEQNPTGYLIFPDFEIGINKLAGTFLNPSNGKELPIVLKKVARRANGSYDFLIGSSNKHYIRCRIQHPEVPMYVVYERQTNKYVTAMEYSLYRDTYTVDFFDVNFDGVDDITFARDLNGKDFQCDLVTYVSTPDKNFVKRFDKIARFSKLPNNILVCYGEVDSEMNSETTLIRWKNSTEYEYLIKKRDWQPFPKLNHHMSPMYVSGADKSIIYAEPTEQSDIVGFCDGGYMDLILVDKKTDKKSKQQWYYCYDIDKGILGWLQDVSIPNDAEYLKTYTRAVVGFAATPKQVEMNLGKPEDKSSFKKWVLKYDCRKIDEFKYDGLSLTYSNSKLIKAEVNKPEIAFDDLYCNKKGCDKDYVIKKYAVTKAELKENKDPSKLEFIRYEEHKYTFEFTKNNLIKSIQFEWTEEDD